MELRLIVEVVTQYLDQQPATDKLRIRLYMALRQAILDRTLQQGVRLPPTRMLAEELDLGRNTVVRAYEQLLVEGYLEGRVGDGTYVSNVVDAASKPAAPKRLIGTRREGLSRRGTGIVNSAACWPSICTPGRRACCITAISVTGRSRSRWPGTCA